MPYYAPFYRPYYTPAQQIADNNQFQYQQQSQPMQQQPMQAPQMPPQQPTMPYTVQNQPTNDFIWVQGEAGAKAYLIAPNATVTLWDSESPTIYIKSADSNGMPSMRTLDFTERFQNAPKSPQTHECQCDKDFVRVTDFQALEAKFEALKEKFDNMNKSEVIENA
jgi:hypothetical protein